ncbi:hypothetical protein N7540_000009 [Penicillium herquei]|nr:hypothetical protein N7540_000009 [Penicillium herquei]
MTTWAPTTHGTHVTSWLPVTAYTPSAACYGYFRYQPGQGLMAFDPAYGYSVNADVTCEPKAITTWYLSLSPANSETYVSLGPMTCPESWSTVAVSEENVSSTAKMCCPSGYYLQSAVEGQLVGFCVSDVTSGQTFTYASTQSGTYTTLTTSLHSKSSVGAYAISGWEILQATTELITSTAPASVSATTTSTASTTTSTSSTSSKVSQSSSSTASSSSHSNEGLSKGATIGIGVGVSLGVVGLVAILVGFYMMGRRSRRKGGNYGQEKRAVELPPASVHNSSSPYSNSTVVSPPGPNNGSELPVAVWQAELDTKANRAELQ